MITHNKHINFRLTCIFLLCPLALNNCASPNNSKHEVNSSSDKNVTQGTMPQLIVNKIYRGEDGKATYRYKGNGELEKWGLDRYNDNSSEKKSSQK